MKGRRHDTRFADGRPVVFKELAADARLNAETVAKRIRKGIAPEQATAAPWQIGAVPFRGSMVTVEHVARTAGVHPHTVRVRLRAGVSAEEIVRAALAGEYRGRVPERRVAIFGEELTYAELGVILDVPKSTVKCRLSSGRCPDGSDFWLSKREARAVANRRRHTDDDAGSTCAARRDV